jgi:hypothetical protein
MRPPLFHHSLPHDSQVKDVVETTEKRIADAGVKCADEHSQSPSLISERRKLNPSCGSISTQPLQSRGPPAESRAVRIGGFVPILPNILFEIGDPRKRGRQLGWHRAVCDYIAGMTDRYAIATHERLFDGARKTAVE